MSDFRHKLRYHPLFEFDIVEANEWYRERSAASAVALLIHVQEAIRFIDSSPFMFPRDESGWRFVRVSKFPYVVVFAVFEQEVFVLGVLHTSRSMQKWMDERGDAK